MIFRFGLHLSICLFILISRLLSFFLPFLLPPTTTIPQQLLPVCLARHSSNFQHYISSFPWFHLKFSRYRKPSNVQNRQHIFMMHNLIHWRLLEGFFQEKQRLRILHHLFSRRSPISPLSPAFIPLLLRSNRGEGESETAGQYTVWIHDNCLERDIKLPTGQNKKMCKSCWTCFFCREIPETSVPAPLSLTERREEALNVHRTF